MTKEEYVLSLVKTLVDYGYKIEEATEAAIASWDKVKEGEPVYSIKYPYPTWYYYKPSYPNDTYVYNTSEI